jgi:cellulose 1,4-beta-cellobiosidase
MRRAAVLLLLAAVGAAAALPGDAVAAAGQYRVTSLCRPSQHLNAGSYTIYNEMLGSREQCLANRNGWSNFRVTASAADSRGPRPLGYPDVYYGCSRRWCSPGTVLPRRVDRLRSPETSWYTTDRAGGQWDASYDLWFTKNRQISGHPNGAELMIWLDERGSSLPTYDGGRFVRTDGASWYMDHWRPCMQGTCWNYVRFWRVHPSTRVRRLRLKPFISVAGRDGLIRRSWWLESIAAGYELWRHGAGLATTWFWARA